MKFNEIKFADNNAARIYKDYISRIQNATKILNAKNQQEILMEINSPIFESLQNNETSNNEVENS